MSSSDLMTFALKQSAVEVRLEEAKALREIIIDYESAPGASSPEISPIINASATEAYSLCANEVF